MRQGSETILYVLALPAVLFLFIAASRRFALGGYRTLLASPGAAVGIRADEVTGTFSGRPAGIGFAPTDYRGRPPFLRVWTESSTPLRMEARRRSLATTVRELAGVLPDRKTGVDELDRLYSFDFDDPARMRAYASRFEFVQSLAALADLGVDAVRLEDGLLLALKRETWLLPARPHQAEGILESLATLARAMESDSPSSRNPHGEPDAVDVGRSRAGGILSREVTGAVVFLSLVIGYLVVAAFWEPNGWLAWTRPERWALVERQLPAATAVAFAGAFAAAWLARWNPLALALALGWTAVLNAFLAWVAYLVIRNLSIPGLPEELAAHEPWIRGMLTTVTEAALAVLAGGLAGGFLGGRQRERAS